MLFERWQTVRWSNAANLVDAPFYGVIDTAAKIVCRKEVWRRRRVHEGNGTYPLLSRCNGGQRAGHGPGMYEQRYPDSQQRFVVGFTHCGWRRWHDGRNDHERAVADFRRDQALGFKPLDGFIDSDSVHPKVSSQLAPTWKPRAGSERALRDQLANRFFDLDVSGRRRALVDMEEQFSVLSNWAAINYIIFNMSYNILDIKYYIYLRNVLSSVSYS